MMCCAACGNAAVDDIKLKDCTACYLVKYCGVKCQKEHRTKHKKGCKKRAAELRDEILFKQPQSNHLGDCPICFLPLQYDRNRSIMTACCSKWICRGCGHANQMREAEEKMAKKCPFCRSPVPTSKEGVDKDAMKRVEVNDPAALRHMGIARYNEGNYKSSFAYLLKGAELGDVGAHYQISLLYRDGEGVEKDVKKKVYHLEEAAIGGHPDARLNLGCIEEDNGRDDRAVKHWIIAANMGHDGSLENLKLVYREGLPASPQIYREGLVSKEDFASALRAHQTAVDATKSPQRETAERFWREEAARGDG